MNDGAKASFGKPGKDDPFPLAFVWKRDVVEARTEKEKAVGLVNFVEHALRYTALIAASNYCEADFKDEQVSHRLERLRRPHTSDYAQFFDIAVPRLSEQGLLFVPEMMEALEKLGHSEKALRLGEGGFEQRLLPLRDALVHLRNALAHGRFRGHEEEFLKYAEPLVLKFKEAMDWWSRYPLYRLVSETQWIKLMGSDPVFHVEEVPEEVRDDLRSLRRRGGMADVLLSAPDLSRFLPVYPFIIWTECPYCKDEKPVGLTEEVFLFTGDEGRKYVAFWGIIHSQVLEKTHDGRSVKGALDNLFALKAVPPEPLAVEGLSYPLLQGRARHQSEVWLQKNILAHRYIPRVYFPREEMEGELERFLEGNKTAFLLLGETGCGKTNLLCRKVEEWTERGEIVLFYAGYQLSVKEDLAERLMQDLILKDELPRLMEFLRRERRRLILVVDGVNEHHAPEDLLRNLCDFINRYRFPGFPLKVVLSVRTVFFDKMLHTLAEERHRTIKEIAEDLFPKVSFQYRKAEREGRQEETYRFELGGLGEDRELQKVYEDYRQYEGYYDGEGNLRRFCPTTPFEGLSPQARQALRHPWTLRMVMEAYNGKPIPSNLWKGEALRQFAQAKIYDFPQRAELVDSLVAWMRKKRKQTCRRDDLHELSPEWSRALREGGWTRSPYVQLLDEGVLLESPEWKEEGRHRRLEGYQIRFAFDELLEYLLSENLLNEAGGWKKVTGENVVNWLKEAGSFISLEEAVVWLLADAGLQGRLSLLAQVVKASTGEEVKEAMGKALVFLASSESPHFEHALDVLAGVENEKVPAVIREAFFQLDREGNYRGALASLQREEKVLRKLIERGERKWEGDLVSLMVWKSVAFLQLGDNEGSLKWAEEAKALCERLAREGRTDLELGELMGSWRLTGIVLAELGKIEEALECYDEAIRLGERGVAEGRGALEEESLKGLAGGWIGKGRALLKGDRIQEASECAKRAVELSERWYSPVLQDLDPFLCPLFDSDWVGKAARYSEAIRYVGLRSEGKVDRNDSWERLLPLINRDPLRDFAIAVYFGVRKGSVQLSIAPILREELGIEEGEKAQENEPRYRGFPSELSWPWYEDVQEICQQLVERGQRDLEEVLARAWRIRGIGAFEDFEFAEAQECFKEAIKIYERLMAEGRRDLEDDGLLTWRLRGLINYFDPDEEDAAYSFNSAVEICEMGIREGRRSKDELAQVLIEGAVILVECALQSYPEEEIENLFPLPKDYLSRAVDLFQNPGRRAVAQVFKGAVCSFLGDQQGALECVEQSEKICEGLDVEAEEVVVPGMFLALGECFAFRRRWEQWDKCAEAVSRAWHYTRLHPTAPRVKQCAKFFEKVFREMFWGGLYELTKGERLQKAQERQERLLSALEQDPETARVWRKIFEARVEVIRKLMAEDQDQSGEES